MSKSIDNATINDFSPSYDSKSRAAYLRAARSFLNVAQKCNVEDEHTKIGEFAGLIKMDASILTRYISALRWGGKFEYEAIAYDIINV